MGGAYNDQSGSINGSQDQAGTLLCTTNILEETVMSLLMSWCLYRKISLMLSEKNMAKFGEIAWCWI